MRTAFGLILLLLVVTIFALSNAGPVTVMFWQWPIYTGSLAFAIVGAGILGAVLVFLPSLIRQSHLGGRIRELERQQRPEEPAGRPMPPGSRTGYPPSPPPSGGVDDTRRFP